MFAERTDWPPRTAAVRAATRRGTGYSCALSLSRPPRPPAVPICSRSVMATINFARREIEAKIVYVGPALSGKTTNVQVLHRLVPKGQRGELHQLSTETDRTLFFDFIPVELGQIAGFTAHFKLFTVPGQVYYQQTRRAVLQGADGVVFVADSSAGRAQANLDAMIDLEQNLRAHGLDLASIPLVVQLNKRDVADALPVKGLVSELNPFDVPVVESIAASGYGVLDTLYKITEIATKRIRENLSGQKNAVRLQAIQRDDRESEQQIVEDYLSRIHKVRPEEDANAERIKAAGRLRPDDVDSFLLEFVDREDDLSLDDGLPAPAPVAMPPEPAARGAGAPPAFAASSPAPAPRVGERKKKGGSNKQVASDTAREPLPPPPLVGPAETTEAERPEEQASPPAVLVPAAPEPARPAPVEPPRPPPVDRAPDARRDSRPPEPARVDTPRPIEPIRPPEIPRPVVETGRPNVPEHLKSSPSRPRYLEGPPIDAHVDAQALAGVLLREVVGSSVGKDGRATIEIVLERGGVARRHLLRFVESTPKTQWSYVVLAGAAGLILGFAAGFVACWKLL